MKSILPPRTRNRQVRPLVEPNNPAHVQMHCPHCGTPVKAMPDAFLNERHCAACDRTGIFVHEPPRHTRHALTMPATQKTPSLTPKTHPEDVLHSPGSHASDANPPSTPGEARHAKTHHEASTHTPHAEVDGASEPMSPSASPASPSAPEVSRPASTHTQGSTRRHSLGYGLAALAVIGLWMLSGIALYTLGQQSAKDEFAALRAAEAQAQATDAIRIDKENQRLRDALQKAEAESDPALRAATLAALRDQARAGGYPIQPTIEDAYHATVLARQEAIHTARLEAVKTDSLALRDRMNLMQLRLDAFAAEQSNQTMAANRMQSQLEQRESEIETLRNQLAQQQDSATDAARTITALKEDTASLQERLREQERQRLQAESDRAAQTRTSTPPPVVVVNSAPPTPTRVNFSITEYRDRSTFYYPVPRRIYRRPHRPPHRPGPFLHNSGGYSGPFLQGGVQFQFRR